MRASHATQLICALATSILLAACSSQSSTPPAPDAVAVLQNIPPADPAKYADLREKKNWQNPYLIVRAENVGLLSGVTANQEQLLKPEEVLDALAHLPPPAWPYGRVIAILAQESRASTEQQKAAFRKNRGAIAGALGRSRVEIVWMPAAKP